MTRKWRPGGLVGLVAVRVALAALTLVVVSVVVFAATQLLPGDAARAKLGKQATKASLAALEKQLGLDRPASRSTATSSADCCAGIRATH